MEDPVRDLRDGSPAVQPVAARRFCPSRHGPPSGPGHPRGQGSIAGRWQRFPPGDGCTKSACPLPIARGAPSRATYQSAASPRWPRQCRPTHGRPAACRPEAGRQSGAQADTGAAPGNDKLPGHAGRCPKRPGRPDRNFYRRGRPPGGRAGTSPPCWGRPDDAGGTVRGNQPPVSRGGGCPSGPRE